MTLRLDVENDAIEVEIDKDNEIVMISVWNYDHWNNINLTNAQLEQIIQYMEQRK